MLLKSEKLTKKQKKEAVDKLFAESCPNYDFFLLLLLSGIIISLGLLADSVAIIIGGMLIAPILSPILSFSMGLVVGDPKLIKRSALIIFQSALLVILTSFVVSSFDMEKQITSQIISRTGPSLTYFLIALFSGFAVSYATIRPSLSEVLPGVAISVALIPPLAVHGIAISMFDWEMMIGSLGMFLLNLFGIVFASLVVYAVLRLYEVKDEIKKKMQAEEKVMQEEQKEREQEKIEEVEKKVKEVITILKKQQGNNKQ